MPKLLPVADLSELTLVPSYKCSSADCVGCYKKSFDGYPESCRDVLDLVALKSFLQRYTSVLRVRSFGITGGEPSEFSGCSELVSMLTGEFPGIAVEIVTNGQDPVRIGEIVRAANRRSELTIMFSIDGYGPTCDLLRGKKDYFIKVLQSISEVAKSGGIKNVRINSRYYPEHEDSIVALSHHLQNLYGFGAERFSLGSVTYRVANRPEAQVYIGRLRAFAHKFWGISEQINIPHTPNFLIRELPYNSKRRTSFYSPAIRPDGGVWTCDTHHGTKVGSIHETDLAGMVGRIVGSAEANPGQCDECHIGQCVLAHYSFQESLSQDEPGGRVEAIGEQNPPD